MAKAIKAAKAKQQSRAASCPPSTPNVPQPQTDSPAIGYETGEIDPVISAHIMDRTDLAKRLDVQPDEILAMVPLNRSRVDPETDTLINPRDPVQNRLLNEDVPTEADLNDLQDKVRELQSAAVEFVEQLRVRKIFLDDIGNQSGSRFIQESSRIIGRCIASCDGRDALLAENRLPSIAQEWKKEFSELIKCGTESRSEIIELLLNFGIAKPEKWLIETGNLLHDLSYGQARDLAFLRAEFETAQITEDHHRQRLTDCENIIANIGIAVDAASKKWSSPKEFEHGAVSQAREMVAVSDSQELAAWLRARNASPASSQWKKGTRSPFVAEVLRDLKVLVDVTHLDWKAANPQEVAARASARLRRNRAVLQRLIDGEDHVQDRLLLGVPDDKHMPVTFSHERGDAAPVPAGNLPGAKSVSHGQAQESAVSNGDAASSSDVAMNQLIQGDSGHSIASAIGKAVRDALLPLMLPERPPTADVNNVVIANGEAMTGGGNDTKKTTKGGRTKYHPDLLEFATRWWQKFPNDTAAKVAFNYNVERKHKKKVTVEEVNRHCRKREILAAMANPIN